ncbi:hypothetical protein [Adhaeribacter rhizoryzae]|uniref:Uncharacterized protein n=1 Tax=Adhaeribacter rhizoryzae TaxID=2607907 RepID=A0A5M6DPZ9_9BACT|nr:hypothetical protein [Adhaeribacter rhizoryzae]KAA5548260.1 hypothetical protein F0145_05910 [Adhaeribacter rhizoryzae]
MMLLDLICFDCIMEQVKNGAPESNIGEPIMTPFEQVNNTGVYEVNCSKGHKSKTVIDNIDFEILYEYGLNAIADGYFREAVSTLTASMERYYEFFIKSILKSSSNEFDKIDKIWKNVSNQSERQLGAYIFLYSQAFGEEPLLLNTNKEVPFRNSVIHKGYIPNRQETIAFADTVMQLIETSLLNLKNKFPEATIETFLNYGYKKTAERNFGKLEKDTGVEQHYACVNIMTTIDVVHGREINDGDGRQGNAEKRIQNILDRRNPRALTLVKDNPGK